MKSFDYAITLTRPTFMLRLVMSIVRYLQLNPMLAMLDLRHAMRSSSFEMLCHPLM